jgi:hypothetical protein
VSPDTPRGDTKSIITEKSSSVLASHIKCPKIRSFEKIHDSNEKIAWYGSEHEKSSLVRSHTHTTQLYYFTRKNLKLGPDKRTKQETLLLTKCDEMLTIKLQIKLKTYVSKPDL